MTYAFAMNRICTGGIGMGRFDLICVCVFFLISGGVDSEEDRGAGACSSAQSWALLQPQHDSCCSESCCSYLSELWASHRGSHEETNIFVVTPQLTVGSSVGGIHGGEAGGGCVLR